MIEIDGSLGEGGGQVIRTAVSIASVLKKNLFIKNIRAGRPKPGLQAQHLTAISAAALLSGGKCSGEFGGTTLTLLFDDSNNRGNMSPLGKQYEFDIGSAGATTLVLQTVLPILLCAPFLGNSSLQTTVSVTGGTAASFAPPAVFFSDSFLPHVNEMLRLQHERNTSLPRINVTVSLNRHGFFPSGGGRITMTINHVLVNQVPQPSQASEGLVSPLRAASLLPQPSQASEGLVSPLRAASLLAPNSLISREIFKALPVLHSKSPKSPTLPTSLLPQGPLDAPIPGEFFSLLNRGSLIAVSSECITMNLSIGKDGDVANMQSKIVDRSLSALRIVSSTIEPSKPTSVQGNGKGNVIFIKAKFENVCSIFSGFSSERGKRDDSFERDASKVADEALREALPYLSSDIAAAPVHHFLADQLLLPLALLGGGRYRYIPNEADKHFDTNCSVIEKFLGKIITTRIVEGGSSQSGVEVEVSHHSHLLSPSLSSAETVLATEDAPRERFDETSPSSLAYNFSTSASNSGEDGLKRKRMGTRRRKKLMKKNAQAQLGALKIQEGGGEGGGGEGGGGEGGGGGSGEGEGGEEDSEDGAEEIDN